MNIREYFAVFSVCLAALSNLIGAHAAGARLVSDVNPGAAGSYPSNFSTFGGSLYFTAYTQNTGFELWRFNGTSVSLVADINPTVDDLGFGVREGNDSIPDWFTELNGSLYFSAYEPGRGAELWRFDGAQAARVSDINPDANDNVKLLPGSSWPKELTVLNNVLYFSATSRTNPNNYELWQYDGATVRQTANLHPDTGADYSSYPNGLTAFNGALYFMADDGTNGWELYRHSGNTTLINIHPGGAESSSYPKYFTAFGTSLYFQAYTAEAGFELWRTDGTQATLVDDLNPGADSSYPEGMTVFQGALYFSGNNGSSGSELQRFDGSSVTLAADINPGGDAYPKNLFVFGDSLFFSANDGVHGWELWKFDGTTATLVTNLNSAGDAFPKNLTVSGRALYFTATTPETGYEVFKFDGTRVTLAGDVNPGPGDSFPRFLHDFSNQLFFSATDNGSSNWELWVLAQGANSNNPPTVSMTSPQNGATFMTTENITLSADATDDGGMVQVEFFANGSSIGSDSTAPYSVTTTLTAGSYVLTAKATDNGGVSATSQDVTITVAQANTNQGPTVVLTSPQMDQVLITPATVILRATATDEDGMVIRVDFFKDQQSIGSDSSAPFELELGNLPAGTHRFTAMATDNAGASGASAMIELKVVDQPTIASISRMDTTISIQVAATEGDTVILESSADLVNWELVASSGSASGIVTFTQPLDGSALGRFYRIGIR